MLVLLLEAPRSLSAETLRLRALLLEANLPAVQCQPIHIIEYGG